MSADGYRDGIRTETEFEENGFGLDPHGCGCTDCLTGQAFPISDMARIKTAMQQGRTLYNRVGYEVYLPNGFRLDDGATWRPGTRDHCPGCVCDPEGNQW